MTLSPFDWFMVAGALTVLLGVCGFLATLYIKGVKEDMKAEKLDRQAGDLKLAELLDGIAAKLNNLERWTASNLISREEHGKVDMKIDAFHRRLDDIVKMLQDMSTRFVSHEECARTHAQ